MAMKIETIFVARRKSSAEKKLQESSAEPSVQAVEIAS